MVRITMVMRGRRTVRCLGRPRHSLGERRHKPKISLRLLRTTATAGRGRQGTKHQYNRHSCALSRRDGERWGRGDANPSSNSSRSAAKECIGQVARRCRVYRWAHGRTKQKGRAHWGKPLLLVLLLLMLLLWGRRGQRRRWGQYARLLREEVGQTREVERRKC